MRNAVLAETARPDAGFAETARKHIENDSISMIFGLLENSQFISIPFSYIP